MLVQRVLRRSRRLSPGRCSATTRPVEPIERYLAYLTDIERSPNTVKAYAHDLKDWFVFLAVRGLDWREVRLEDLGEFVAWLRLPPPARDGRVAMLPSAEHHCAASHGQPEAVGAQRALHAPRPPRRRSRRAAGDLAAGAVAAVGWKPFLHHISKGEPQPRRTITLKAPRKLPRILTAARCRRSWTPATGCGTGCCSRCCMTPACGSARRSGCGMRTWPPPSGELTVHAAGQRQRGTRQVGDAAHDPGQRRADPAVCRLPARRVRRPGLRLRVRQPVGPAARPSADLPGGLRPGAAAAPAHRLDFDPHWYRHTAATRLLRDGVADRGASAQLLGHASITTTADIYGHLSVEDARRAPGAAGWFTGRRCGGDRAGRQPAQRRRRAAGQAHGRRPPRVPRDILVPERGALVFGTAPCRVRRLRPAAAHPGAVQGHSTSGRTRAAPTSTRSPRRRPRRDAAAGTHGCSCRDAVTAGPPRAMRPPPRVLGTRRPAGPRGMAGRPAPVHDPRHPVGVPAPVLHAVDAGTLAVLRHHPSPGRRTGRPDIDEFVGGSASPTGDDRFDFRPPGWPRS